MAGRIITHSGGVMAQHPTGVTPAKAILTDENGFTCCCDEPNCCNTCVKSERCNNVPCGTVTTKTCCYNDGDKLVDGYWYYRTDEGPNFWIVEITQTSDGTLSTGGHGAWDFQVTIRQRCRVSGIIRDRTRTGVAATLLAGFNCQGLLPQGDRCRQLGTPSGSYAIQFPDDCCAFDHELTCIWGEPFLLINFRPDCNTYYDPFPENANCFEDNRSASWSTPPCAPSQATYQAQIYHRIEQCAERCTGGCTTCP